LSNEERKDINSCISTKTNTIKNKQQDSIFEYSINNHKRIEEVDNKLLYCTSIDDSFEVTKEIESTQKHIDKLEELRNQLLWLDHERIKKRINLE